MASKVGLKGRNTSYRLLWDRRMGDKGTKGGGPNAIAISLAALSWAFGAVATIKARKLAQEAKVATIEARKLAQEAKVGKEAARAARKALRRRAEERARLPGFIIAMRFSLRIIEAQLAMEYARLLASQAEAEQA